MCKYSGSVYPERNFPARAGSHRPEQLETLICGDDARYMCFTLRSRKSQPDAYLLLCNYFGARLQSLHCQCS